MEFYDEDRPRFVFRSRPSSSRMAEENNPKPTNKIFISVSVEKSKEDEEHVRMNLLGVNLKIASFMPQFHSSRSDCNLCASWVRFLQTTKFCVLLDIKEKTLKKLSKQAILGGAILVPEVAMQEESKEDEEHVRDLLENLIKCLDENKIVLRLQVLEGIRHLNIKKLLDYQIKILDDCIETNNKLIEAIEACLRDECSCGKKNKLIEAMEACSLEDCSSSSMAKVLTSQKPNN
ncbi:hypothetical protein HID58_048643 [Brassica napus]|uniref:Uncharacterized protein n=1 Tax=Brassica napus TaxID=3708 RepID=A0ABQ8B2Q5_BRANA|nr:hypothetical protein HID58_048643 [Brassica napus]